MPDSLTSAAAQHIGRIGADAAVAERDLARCAMFDRKESVKHMAAQSLGKVFPQSSMKASVAGPPRRPKSGQARPQPAQRGISPVAANRSLRNLTDG